MPPRNVLSVKQLAGAVEQAVKVAGDRHKLQFEPQYTINGLINGRILREAAAIDLNAVRQASEQIAQQAAGALPSGAAGATRLHLEPAVLVNPKYILCGFIAAPTELLAIE